MINSTQSKESYAVRLCRDLPDQELDRLADRFGVKVQHVEKDQVIPGSYWGEVEAGLIACNLYVRTDTPVHSALHELCHFVCMDKTQRQHLDTNAGGDYDEENAVCYLQILLADKLTNFDRQAMMMDMDSWGYTFRLGSAQAWFEQDAEDARAWLINHQIINHHNRPTWQIRDQR